MPGGYKTNGPKKPLNLCIHSFDCCVPVTIYVRPQTASHSEHPAFPSRWCFSRPLGAAVLPESMQVAWLPGGRCLATPCTPAPSVLPLTDMATSSYSSSSSESRESEASVSPVQLPPTPPPTSIAIFKSPRESKSSSSKTSHWSSSEESLPAAAFYGPLDAKNPLLVSCDKEIRELLGFIKKKKALATSEEQKHEFHRRW